MQVGRFSYFLNVDEQLYRPPNSKYRVATHVTVLQRYFKQWYNFTPIKLTKFILRLFMQKVISRNEQFKTQLKHKLTIKKSWKNWILNILTCLTDKAMSIDLGATLSLNMYLSFINEYLKKKMGAKGEKWER